MRARHLDWRFECAPNGAACCARLLGGQRSCDAKYALHSEGEFDLPAKKKKAVTARKTSSVDTYIGERLRERRRELGMSQGALAEALNISFQQIQKYEQGTNRVAAATLFQICTIIGVDISYFLPEPQKGAQGASELAAVARVIAKAPPAARGGKVSASRGSKSKKS